MTARGPIAARPLAAEPTLPGPVALIQALPFTTDPDDFPQAVLSVGAVALSADALLLTDGDTFFAGNLLGGEVPLTQTLPFDDLPDTFFAATIAGGTIALSQNTSFSNLPDTFFAATFVATGATQALTQASRFDDLPDQFYEARIGGRRGGSSKKKVKLQWRDTVAEAAARLLEQQLLEQQMMQAAMEAEHRMRRRIALATALLMVWRMDDLDLPQFDKHYDELGKQYDELVKTCLVGKAIVDEFFGESLALNLLLKDARQRFVNAALIMLNGDLDFYTEKGIARAAKTQDDLRFYQEMINRIGEAIAKARDAQEGKGFVEEEMKVLYDDG